MMTLSRTVMLLKIVVSWNVRTTPLRATMCGARSEMRSPLKRTSPDVGRRKDEISLNSVDLPAPFGPMTDRISFSRHRKETSLTATRPPKRLVRPDDLEELGHRLSPSSVATEPRLSMPFGRNSISDDQQRRIDQQLELAGLEQQVPAEIEDQRAEHRPEDVAEAAEEAVQHEVDRIGDGEARRVDRLRDRHEDGAGNAAEEGRDGIGDDPQIRDVDADGGGELLVLLQRLAQFADARIDQPVHGRQSTAPSGHRQRDRRRAADSAAWRNPARW